MFNAYPPQRCFVSVLFFLSLLLLSPLLTSAQSTSILNCTLCPNETHVPHDPDAKLVLSSVQDGSPQVWTCLDLHQQSPFLLSPGNCTVLQSHGQDLCLCGDVNATPPPTNENCTLCRPNGSTLPQPLLQSIVPDKSCAQLQVQAKRDAVDTCWAYQVTAGVYCGCQQHDISSDDGNVCRLCGDGVLLPEPTKVLSLHNATPAEEDSSLTCGVLEWQANLPSGDNDCAQFRQHYDSHVELCCQNVVTPTAAPSGALRGNGGGVVQVKMTATIALWVAWWIIIMV